MTISEVSYPIVIPEKENHPPSEVYCLTPEPNEEDCTFTEEGSDLKRHVTEIIGSWSCFNLSQQLGLSRTEILKRRSLRKQSARLLDLYTEVDGMSEEQLELSVNVVLLKIVRKDRGIKNIRLAMGSFDSPDQAPKM